MSDLGEFIEDSVERMALSCSEIDCSVDSGELAIRCVEEVTSGSPKGFALYLASGPGEYSQHAFWIATVSPEEVDALGWETDSLLVCEVWLSWFRFISGGPLEDLKTLPITMLAADC